MKNDSGVAIFMPTTHDISTDDESREFYCIPLHIAAANLLTLVHVTKT